MRSPRVVIAIVLAAAALGAVAPPSAGAAAAPTQTLGSGAWIWFSDPRAVYYAGQHRRSYTTWVNADGNAILGSFDHDTQVVSTVVLRYGVGRDDHANPTLLMLPGRPAGRLLLEPPRAGHFLPGHAVPGGHRVARAGAQGAALRPDRFGSTYPDAHSAEPRGGASGCSGVGPGGSRPSPRAPTGRRWSRPKTLIRENIPGKRHRPYVKVASNGVDTIHFAFTEAHPGRYPTAIYYAKYREGLFWARRARRSGR